MKISFVKKILENGDLCPKCIEVEQRLIQADQMQFIDQILVADERDATSPGMQLAAQHRIERAPFFIVETPGKPPQIYTVYLKFVREILNSKVSDTEEAQEILRNNSDLDFL